MASTEKKLLKVFAFLAVSLAVGRAHLCAAEEAQHLPVVTFTVCGVPLKLEVASTEKERAIGLMHRSEVLPGTGMLFSFPAARPLSFWMRNVPFDIDIAYFDAKGKLLNTMTMAGTSPLMRDEALPQYESRGPALYAVEAQAQFFATKNKASCRIHPLPKLGQ